MNPVGRHCAYQKLDTNIREFVFLKKSPAAVDEWIRPLDGIMMNDPPQDGVKERLLIDVRQHVPGLIYAASKLHAWRKDYETNDDNRRTAILLDKQSQMVVDVTATIIQAMGLQNVKVRFFNHDRQKAIDWLLSEK